eukprot:m.172441 g.172441  ORF g.172441 m.172441 type:complete len:204 (+) comp13537_c0_seq1:60-671(+)
MGVLCLRPSLVVALAAAVLAAGAWAHTSRLPGRFEKPLWNGPPAPSGCSTAFTLDGVVYNVSDLQVDVGGYIANNAVDKFSYCINLCKTVTSERNCICYACGGQEYPASQIVKDSVKGEVCQQYLGQVQDAQWSRLPDGSGLRLTYAGGEHGVSAVIDLPCDPTQDGTMTGPTFVGASASVYKFTWNSSLACGNKTEVLPVAM